MSELSVKKKPKYSLKERREHRQGWIFMTPALLVISIFSAAAVFYVVYLSFFKVNLFTHTNTFVGLDNYRKIFTDSIARKALTNTLTFSATVVPLQTIFALIIAAVLNSNIRGKYTFRVIYFLPTLTSSSALTMIFMFICSVNGPINNMLLSTGVIDGAINFLQEPEYSLRVIMGMNIWSTVPMYTTLYLASLQDLPKSMYEAADIDGAGPIRKFWSITVPYLRPITTYVLLTGIIGTLQMFDQAYIFSNGSGGPANSTLTIALLVYRYAFGQLNSMGYAATMAIFLAVIIFIISRITEHFNETESIY